MLYVYVLVAIIVVLALRIAFIAARDLINDPPNSILDSGELYPCSCCGYQTLESLDGPPPGTFQYCEVCSWQDDDIFDPHRAMGANQISLVEAQRNFVRYGAMDKGSPKNAEPRMRYERDPDWKPIEP